MDNDWKKEASRLAAMERINPFTVPEGYFDSLTGEINSQLLLSELHPGNATGKFTVPDGYFESLTAQIEGQVIVEKLKEEFVVNHFTVPEGYFSKLQDRINAKTEEPAKVISIRPRKKLAWVSYAAAACITIALSITLYLNISNTADSRIVNPVTANSTDFSNVSDEDIINYLQIRSTRADMPVIIENLKDNVTSVTDDISTEDVQEYLNNNTHL